MPGKKPVAHFDISELLRQAQASPAGIAVSTNHPAGFQRVVYAYIRANPARRVRLTRAPVNDGSTFWLIPLSVVEAHNVKDRA